MVESLGDESAHDRTRVSTLVSVAVHVAVLCFISTGQPGGVPWGTPGGSGQVYSLSYLGEYVDVGSGDGLQERVPSPAVAQPDKERDQGVKPKTVPLRSVVRETGQQSRQQSIERGGLLASERGEYVVPVAPKAKEPSKKHGGEAVAVPTDVGAVASTTQSTDGGEGKPGGAAGAPPPPRGAGMVGGLPRLVYPKALQNQEVKGTVGLKVTVDREGRPTGVAVERSSGEPRLDEYARRAVQRGLHMKPWTSPYVLRVEARFAGGAPEVRVLDEPVEVGG